MHNEGRMPKNIKLTGYIEGNRSGVNNICKQKINHLTCLCEHGVEEEQNIKHSKNSKGLHVRSRKVMNFGSALIAYVLKGHGI